jgi:hypothetical protein
MKIFHPYLTAYGEQAPGIRKAVREVIARHKETGRWLAIWENGRVRRVAANH